MTDLYEMNNSAVEWLTAVEPKIFVAKWMTLRTKTTPTTELQKKLTITGVIGGVVRTRLVPIPCQSGTDLTSNKHCLPCSNWNKKKKKLNETKDGHKVLLRLHGGVGKVLGGLLIPMKVTMEMNQVLIEQGDLLYKYLEQFFKAWFSWIHLLVTDGSFTADGGLLLPTVSVNTTPQTTYFFGAKRVQNNYRLKLWWIVTAWEQDENLDTKWKNQIMYEWVTIHIENANDNMYACVTLHDTNVNDDIHVAWPSNTSTECRAHFLGGVVVSSSSHTHALWLKFESFIPSPWPSMCVRSLHLDPPFLLLAPPSTPFPLPQLHVVYGKPAQLVQWGCGRLWGPPPLHTIRAFNVKRGWHRLQNTRIATFCCETSWELSCSWPREADREPPSSTSSSTRSTTKQCLQPI